MDYKQIKALVESGHAEAFCEYIQDAIDQLRDKSVAVNLPADEYKIASLGRDEAVNTLKKILQPFLEYEHVEKKAKGKVDLYHTHQPMV